MCAMRTLVREQHQGPGKFLYGLKQAPCAWNAKITQQLRRMGFATSKSDSSLFIRKSRLRLVSILLYVDDLVITGADLDEINRVKLQLAASFDMKDLGDLHYFLGIEVIRQAHLDASGQNRQASTRLRESL